MSGGVKHRWLRWGGGFLASCLFIWAVSAFFLQPVLPFTLDPQLEEHVPVPGTTVRFVDEGWGSTTYGQHRSIGPAQWDGPRPHVLFWGDSHLEAYHLDDDRKIPAVFTGLCAEAGLDLDGINLGRSGASVADYAFLAPAYRRIAGPPAAHVILLVSTKDLIPGKQSEGHSRFAMDPVPRFEYVRRGPSRLTLRWAPLFHNLHLQLAYDLYQRLRSLKLRFAPGGPASPSPQPAAAPRAAPKPDLETAWPFLLEELTQRMSAPIVFVYCPRTPTIHKGRIETKDGRAPQVARFAALCRERGIAFLNMTETFTRFYERTGNFVHGSANGRPGKGHLNQDAHALIAEAVFNYLKENQDALLAH